MAAIVNAADLSPVQRFLVNARQIALARPVDADYRLYERFKADLQRIVETIDNAAHVMQRAMQELNQLRRLRGVA